jgi:DNA-binding response OmpR family regulator
LQAHIASIRKRIEPNPAKPRYLITWHGRPGGYQFFPEGKPE